MKIKNQTAGNKTGDVSFQLVEKNQKTSKNLRDFSSISRRRKFLEENFRVSLKNIGSFTLDEKTAAKRNCENMIGAAQIPLGVAGPLMIKNSKSTVKNYYIPLATTEGALVASVNRGCKAVTESGGVTVMVENVGATRGPVFETSGIVESLWFKKWLDQNFENLALKARETSSHLKLIKLGARIAGRNVYIRFYFDTKDAMGMNMATIATEKMVEFIESKTRVRCLSLAGNFDIDKKPAWLNFISGRGKRVWAEAVIKKAIIKEILKTSAEKIYHVWLAKCLIGSFMSGSLGFNSHFANIIAALFIATGQDVAHVVEGSLGVTTTQVLDDGSLYFSIYLPDLMVGTVGGGTALSTQKEALSLLGIDGGDEGKNALKFAEIVGGAVLSGELSLLSSLAEGSLAKAHIRLARGKS